MIIIISTHQHLHTIYVNVQCYRRLIAAFELFNTLKWQRCKQPTRCNNFRSFIFLLIYFDMLCMFRATNSPIFRSTFDCIYSFGTMHRYCCRPVTRFHLKLVAGRQQYRCIVPKLYIQSKVPLKIGEFVARSTKSRSK